MTKDEKRIYDKEYAIKNKEKKSLYNKNHRKENKEHYREYVKKYAEDNKEKITEYHRSDRIREYGKIYREVNKQKLLDYAKEYRKSHKKEVLDGYLKWTYGVDVDSYFSMVDEQDGKCAICGITQEELDRRLHVDHDHFNGTIRGLLCRNCNLLLGYSKDSIEVLEKSILYLKKYGDNRIS